MYLHGSQKHILHDINKRSSLGERWVQAKIGPRIISNQSKWSSWALNRFQWLLSGWSFTLCITSYSQQLWLIYNVQCILDCFPVSVNTEPFYSHDQFAHSYSNPYKRYISDLGWFEIKQKPSGVKVCSCHDWGGRRLVWPLVWFKISYSPYTIYTASLGSSLIHFAGIGVAPLDWSRRRQDGTNLI